MQEFLVMVIVFGAAGYSIMRLSEAWRRSNPKSGTCRSGCRCHSATPQHDVSYLSDES